MGLGLLHPNANPISGIAHWLLNIAIWAPLFWVGRINVSARAFKTVLMLLWLFNVTSAIVGVLQVYFPDRFAPSAEFVRILMGTSAEGLLIERADGVRVWRPFGLSDTPGGAAVSGSFAVVVGIFFLLSRPSRVLRALSVVGIFAGVFCLYVCELRSLMVITVVGAGVLVLLQLMQGRINRTVASLLILPLILVLAFNWTRSVGTERIENRMRTLAEGSMASVYYKNRGYFVETTITEELPRYPLGSGLGRYGMMYRYFGDPTLPHSHELWVEVQITGWLYDGGLPMVLLGYGAVLAACMTTFRFATSRRVTPAIAEYAAVVTALNAGWLAATFNYPLFLSPTGLVFWLLNAALFAAANSAERSTQSRITSAENYKAGSFRGAALTQT
ncbi:MAG: hypothetical protein C0483_16345 [Pirellula sp.]|nr:hypothetical protein [Pirellula sp.]